MTQLLHKLMSFKLPITSESSGRTVVDYESGNIRCNKMKIDENQNFKVIAEITFYKPKRILIIYKYRNFVIDKIAQS